jgi:hypothetical protein
MYKIKGWMPNRQNQMGGSGFSIVLTQKWREAVEKAGLTQANADKFLSSDVLKELLKQHGFSAERTGEVRIHWGAWGIEHISVPGNACGLDINYSPMGYIWGEVSLDPHNVDTIYQASLILAIFLWFADILEYA